MKFTSEQLDWIVQEFRTAAVLAAKGERAEVSDGVVFVAGSFAAALQEGNPEFDEGRLMEAVCSSS